MPSAGVVAGSPGAGRETRSIPPDCDRVPVFGVTTGATEAGWKKMSISPDRAHVSDAGVAAKPPGLDRETMPIPSDFERVPGTSIDTSDPFYVHLCVDDGILVEVRFFQDGRRLRLAIESLTLDPFQFIGPRGP